MCQETHWAKFSTAMNWNWIWTRKQRVTTEQCAAAYGSADLQVCVMVRPGFAAGAAALALCLAVLALASNSRAQSPSAVGPGLPHARVIVVQDPEATQAFVPREHIIRAMVDQAVIKLSSKATVAEAWRSVAFTNGAIASNDLVGIKVFSAPGPNCGTRPAVAMAVVEGLLAAGVPPKQILVWDRQSVDLRLAGYFDLVDRYGIRVEGSAQAGYDAQTFYDSSLIGSLVWGDLEFGQKGSKVGRRSFVSKLVTQQITKIINITPMLNHNLAGVTGNLYSLAVGSVDNFARFESDASRLATAVPEIYNLPTLNDRVVLNITDALICQYEGSERGLLHYSTSLNQIRVSRDPVALDSLSLLELDLQRQAANMAVARTNSDLYSNAALLELGISDLKRIDVQQAR